MAQVPLAKRPLPVGALRFGAVLAASGPVVLRTARLGLADVHPGICFHPADALLVTGDRWWWLLSWAEILLPVVLAGLLLHAPRRAVPLGVTAVCAVLAFRLFAVSLPLGLYSSLPGLSLPAVGPWPSAVCYAVAVVALLLTARTPPFAAHRGTPLWPAAVVAAAWTLGRLTFTPQEAPSFGWFAYPPPTLLWKTPGAWSCKADADGLWIALIALAAAAGTVLAGRPWRRVTAGLAVLLVLGAVEELAALLIATAVTGGYASLPDNLAEATVIRWHLLAAAGFIMWAAFRSREPSTAPEKARPRTS